MFLISPSHNIHASHWRELKNACLVIALAAAVLLGFAVIPEPDFTDRVWQQYLSFHTLVEMIAVAIALLIFSSSWIRLRWQKSFSLAWIACWFLGVALLDLAHLLSYEGMPDFVTPSDPEKTIYFWLAARTLSVVALLGVLLLPSLQAHTERQHRRYRMTLLLVVLMLTAIIHWILLGYPHWLPTVYTVEVGLTEFKKRYEYVLIVTYLLAAYGFWRLLKQERTLNVSGLMAAAIVMAMAEYCFTLYGNMADTYNLLGHVYKIIAYGFLFHTLFIETVQRPYFDLQRSEQRLQQTIDALPDLIFELDAQGRYLAVHSGRTELLAASPKELLGKTIQQSLPVSVADICWQAMRSAQQHGTAHGYHIQLLLPIGIRYFELSVSYQEHENQQQYENQQVRYIVVARDVTERTQQQALIKREAVLNEMLSRLPLAVQQQDERRFLSTVIQYLAELTESPAAALAIIGRDGKHIDAIIWSDETDRLPSQLLARVQQAEDSVWQQVLSGSLPSVANDIHLSRFSAEAHDDMVIHRAIHHVVQESVPRLVGVAINRATPYSDHEQSSLSIFLDSVWSHLMRQRQQQEIRKLSAAIEQSPFPVIMTDLSGAIEYVNQAFTDLSGYALTDVLGRNPRLLKSGQTPVETYRMMWQRLQQGQTWQGELINKTKDGRVYTESVVIYPVRNEQQQVTHYIGHKEDLSQRKALEHQVQQLSEFDQLTGLPNRTVINRRFLRALEHNAEAEQAVLWIDIDNFKHINDNLGHDFGDALLQQLAERLRLQLNEHDMLARQSGDSFMLVLTDCDQDQAPLRAAALLQSVQQPFSLLSQEIIISASIGIALYPSDGNELDALCSAAEIAMYQVKQEGRNSFRFYSSELQAQSARTLALSNALKHAIARHELHVVYQPQYDLTENRMIGAEVLCRWQHSELGYISPAEFIPLAEQTGQITVLGDWVMNTAVKQLRQWQDAGLDISQLAINLSAVQFNQPHLVDHISALVAAHGVAASCIELELTEAVALTQPERAREIMDGLHQAGFVLALDDFGTGYSSMSYLKRFALHKLKIDQSFVRDLIEDRDDQAIVTAIIQMAHSLGMVTIAEGVETEAQLAFLRARGCDQIQGYHYARPLTAEQFEDFVAIAGKP